jgi:hypothetical protein
MKDLELSNTDDVTAETSNSLNKNEIGNEKSQIQIINQSTMSALPNIYKKTIAPTRNKSVGLRYS